MHPLQFNFNNSTAKLVNRIDSNHIVVVLNGSRDFVLVVEDPSLESSTSNKRVYHRKLPIRHGILKDLVRIPINES